MKIHYDKDITKSYHVTELHYTDTIELDGVKLIPITELEKIKAELNNLDFDFGNYYDETEAILNKINSVLDKHIAELKGENNE